MSWQFVGCPWNFVMFLLESGIQGAKYIQFVVNSTQGAEKGHESCQCLAVCLCGHKAAILWCIHENCQGWQFCWQFLKLFSK